MTWDLSRLTENQRKIIETALARCDFPFEKLSKQNIPVEFADLSRYAGDVAASYIRGHVHVAEGHVLASDLNGRRAALGLAWYSGKISIEKSIEDDPDLASEVFLAEGAHMVDFFYMTKEQKQRIFAAYHRDGTGDHGHDWFDDEEGVGDPRVKDPNYWAWVGESFMSGFILAYAPTQPAPLAARQRWVHPTTADVAAKIREILTPAPKPPPPPSPGPPPAASEFAGTPWSKVFHKPGCRILAKTSRKRKLTPEEVALRRACTYCKPTR